MSHLDMQYINDISNLMVVLSYVGMYEVYLKFFFKFSFMSAVTIALYIQSVAVKQSYIYRSAQA